MAQKRAHFVRQKNRAEGRGSGRKIFPDCTGSHVVFPLEDPLLPGFCRSPAHALIWSLLRVACMLRHCWNDAALSFSPPPHLLSTLFLFSERLAVLLCTAFTSDCLFFRTGRPALAYYLTHLKSAIVRRVQIYVDVTQNKETLLLHIEETHCSSIKGKYFSHEKSPEFILKDCFLYLHNNVRSVFA